MPPTISHTLFLGVELATDQLRAVLLDDQLDILGVENVDFDAELPEYQTSGGMFTTPGNAYTTPVDMWVKAFDLLLEKLRNKFDLSKVKAIGGSAQSALVWWKAEHPPLYGVTSKEPLHPQTKDCFSSTHTHTSQDTLSPGYAEALESWLGGYDGFASRSGVTTHASLAAVQILHIKRTLPPTWATTKRVVPASTFLASLFISPWAPTAESEAVATGLWSNGNGTLPRGWDKPVLDLVSESPEEGERLKRMLGEVEGTTGSRKIGNIAQYHVERYGFSPETIVTPFTSDALSSYLSLAPSQHDAVLCFGPSDFLLTPVPNFVPDRSYTILPHPVQDPSEKRKYIAVLMNRNGDVPRALVRDMYTKSWSAFDRLVAIVPPGGSIGLDDKLFSFWLLQSDYSGTPSSSSVKGIFRFETGIKVQEFRDLRANPRCLIESQLLSFRVRYAHLRGSKAFQSASRTMPNILPTPPPHSPYNPNTPRTTVTIDHSSSSTNSNSQSNSITSSLLSRTLQFDPYAMNLLPKRIFTTGAAANFGSIIELIGDIFNAPVYIPATQVESAQKTPQRNAPAPGCASRATLGSAYVARWVWGRERVDGGGNSSAGSGGSGSGSGGLSFEDEIKRLLGKRWIATGGASVTVSKMSIGASSGSPSGAASPAYHSRLSGGLGTTMVVEEDEEEDEPGVHAGVRMYQQTHGLGVGVGSGSGSGLVGMGGSSSMDGLERDRMRTISSSGTITSSSTSTYGLTPSIISTALTSPDLHGNTSSSSINNLNNLSLNNNNNNGGTGMDMSGSGSGSTASSSAAVPAGVTPLTPVAPLYTNDAEAQIGLAKVAEPDSDAFMVYASIIPEFRRLEQLLVKSVI